MARRLAALLLSAVAMAATAEAAASRGQVVLLHGLARSAASMAPLAEYLERQGYLTCNLAYPSTEYSIETLAAEHVMPAIRRCFPDAEQPLYFVSHSLGGIITRQLAAGFSDQLRFARVVMLAPPNHGSEVVDVLGGWWLFGKINGPAGAQLGTGESSLPRQLGGASFELGVIAGDVSVNLLLSLMIKGADDGKVSLDSARLDGMRDFIVLPYSHPFIMKREVVWQQVDHFFQYGEFAE